VSFPVGFPHRFARLDQPATGSIDEVRWLTVDASGPASDDVPPGAALFVRGWALHVDGNGPATCVVVRIDGARNYPARIDLPRPDVASSLGKPGLERTGFEAIVPTGLLAPGVHEVSICSVDTDSMWFAEANQRTPFFLLGTQRSLPASIPLGGAGCEATIDAITNVSADRAFDFPFQTIEASRGSLIAVRGWAYDDIVYKPAAAVFGLVDGRLAFKATYGIRRPDVAQSRGLLELEPVGFTIEIPTIELERGLHRLEIVALNASEDRLVHSKCVVELVIRERDGKPRNAAETTPAFLDSVVRVANGQGRERITPLRATRGDQLFVRGWAIDGVAGTIGAGVLLVIDETIEINALYGLKRPDIAEAHENPDLERCGFTAEIRTDTLAPGRHSVKCFVIARDGRGTLATAQQFEFEVSELTSGVNEPSVR
jgi:hypothetical protein